MTSAFVRLLLVSSSQLESRGRGRAESDVLRHAEAVLGNLRAIILKLTTSDSVRFTPVVAATSETRRMRREAVMVGCMQMQGACVCCLLARILFCLAPFSKRRYRQFRISQLSLLFCRFRFPRVGRPRSRSKISALPIQHHHLPDLLKHCKRKSYDNMLCNSA